MTKRMTMRNALDAVAESADGIYAVVLEHGSMELGYYCPKSADAQQPHARDEVYIIVSGSGEFFCDGKRQPFESGEALFVPAGVAHRFESFSKDFAAWVVFYGPDGGEA